MNDFVKGESFEEILARQKSTIVLYNGCHIIFQVSLNFPIK